MSKFSAYEYKTQPGFDQSKFEGAKQAIPMKTFVIDCFDPRAAEIPQKVAEYFGDEVYPDENILDEAGNRVGNTRTLFAETNARRGLIPDVEVRRLHVSGFIMIFTPSGRLMQPAVSCGGCNSGWFWWL